MLSTKKLLYKVTEAIKSLNDAKVTVYKTNATSSSMTIAADARSHVRIPDAVPSGVTDIGIVVNQTPNNDWVRTMAYMDGTDVIIRYHNEYTGSLTGSFNAVVSYVTVGSSQ